MPCNLDHDVRKTLLSCGIWGQHHGCHGVDNPVRGSPHNQPRTINVHLTWFYLRRVHRITNRRRFVLPVRSDHDTYAALLAKQDSPSSSDSGQTDVAEGAMGDCMASINVVTSYGEAGADHRNRAMDLNNLVRIQRTGNKHSKQLNFGLLNVRSIGDDTKSGQVHDFVTAENFDCLELTETWLCPDDMSQQQIGDITGTGLSFHHKPRKSRKGGGGGSASLQRMPQSSKLLPNMP